MYLWPYPPLSIFITTYVLSKTSFGQQNEYLKKDVTLPFQYRLSKSYRDSIDEVFFEYIEHAEFNIKGLLPFRYMYFDFRIQIPCENIEFLLQLLTVTATQTNWDLYVFFLRVIR